MKELSFRDEIKSKLNSFFSQFGCIHNLNELINVVQMFHSSNVQTRNTLRAHKYKHTLRENAKEEKRAREREA